VAAKKAAQTLAGYLARCSRFSDIKIKSLDVSLTRRVAVFSIVGVCPSLSCEVAPQIFET